MHRIEIFVTMLLLIPALQLPAAPGSSSQGNAKEGQNGSSREESPAAFSPEQRLAEETLLLDDLVDEALRNNREIRAAQKKYEASRQRPSQFSSLPDPLLSFASNNIGNPIPLTTVGEEDMSMTGFELTQELPFPGKLPLKGRMAQKEADADWHGFREAQLRVVSQIKQAFYRLHFAYQALEVVQKDKDLLEKFAKITEARYAVGKGIQPDVLQAQVELTALERKVVELEREKGSLEAKLNSLLNRPPDSPVGRPQDYPKALLSASLEELYQSARANAPPLGQEQARIEKNTYALELARKEYYPDFAIETGWASRGRLPNLWMTRVEVKVPLYFWRKQRYAVRESANSLEQSRREYEATAQNLSYRIKDDYLMSKASEQLIELYSKAMIPQATLALESSMASYQVGTVDFLSLLTNFLHVLEYELEYYREVANFHEALARLEETSGRRLLP